VDGSDTNKWKLWIGGIRVTVMQNGNVGIGTTTPDALLSVNGTADKPGGGSWSTFSDARLKDVGAAFTHGMEALEALRPIHYHYKPDNPLNLPSQPDYIGVTAQQVQGVIPEAVQKHQDGYLTVNNDPIIWTMVNAIKELNQKHEAEEKQKDAEIAALKSKADQVDALQKRLDELETTVKALAEKK
jgi:polyhydroxyalkanoate synthesis regulator phasin